jgi:peptidoglycan/LPS O-acetylase OafA/YrhL
VPQAWTLALELTFYLIAPILNRQNTPVLVSIAAASLGVRLVTYFVLGFHHDPWTYRFFPSELMFFVSGMLSFRIYSHSSPGLDLRWSRLVWFSLIAATVVFQYLPGGSIKLMAYFILVFLGLPFVFRATRKSVIDRQLGEMSYPIYLSHLVVFAFFNSFPMFARNNLLLQITSLSTTIFVSFLLVRFVSRSLEGFRQRRATARWEGINSPMFAKSKYSVS